MSTCGLLFSAAENDVIFIEAVIVGQGQSMPATGEDRGGGSLPDVKVFGVA